MAVITGHLRANFTLEERDTTGLLAGQSIIPVGKEFQFEFRTSGTVAEQCNLRHASILTFVASTPQTINMRALVGLRGEAQTWARVRAIAIRFLGSTDASWLDLGGDGTADAWVGGPLPDGTSKMRLYPSTAPPAGSTTNSSDGYWVHSAPGTIAMVVGATNRLLKMTPSAHAFSIEFLVAGNTT